MDKKEVAPNVFAMIRPDFDSNVSLIYTDEGWIVVDTTTGEEPMQEVLDAAGVTVGDVKLLLITHADGDHIGGNTLFDCPIVASQATYDTMAERSNIPKNARPTETFDSKLQKSFGGVEIEMVHVGGHKPDLAFVWLPQPKVLIPADQVFVGRYPFMLNAQPEVWIESLKKIGEWGAETIIPGHGDLPQQADIDRLIEYIEATWQRTKDHAVQGDSLKETLADPDYIRHADWAREQLFEKNIEVMYEQLTSGD